MLSLYLKKDLTESNFCCKMIESKRQDFAYAIEAPVINIVDSMIFGMVIYLFVTDIV